LGSTVLFSLSFQQRIESSRVLVLGAYSRLYQATLLGGAHQCLHLSVEVVSVLQRMATL